MVFKKSYKSIVAPLAKIEKELNAYDKTKGLAMVKLQKSIDLLNADIKSTQKERDKARFTAKKLAAFFSD